MSFRSVRAYRASLDYGRTGARTSWSVVPYFRYDSMELLPNWTLTFDPTVYTTDNASVGLLAKWQRDLTPMRTTLLAGVDVDVSPGARTEDIVRPQTSASGLPSGRPIFSSYTTGARIYDYDVTFAALSPYVQADFSPRPRMRVSLGVRADGMRYDYDDLLTSPDTPRHRRPADAVRTFTHVSPKVGWTFQVSDRANLFASYRHAFRCPPRGSCSDRDRPGTRSTSTRCVLTASKSACGLRHGPLESTSRARPRRTAARRVRRARDLPRRRRDGDRHRRNRVRRAGADGQDLGRNPQSAATGHFRARRLKRAEDIHRLARASERFRRKLRSLSTFW